MTPGRRIRLNLRGRGYRKLDEQRVAAMKWDLAHGMGVCEAAAKYRVAQATVSSIKGNRNWARVPWPEIACR